jgi:hypothetical protein
VNGETSHISTYPVGLFSDFRRKRVLYGLRNYVWMQAKRGNWRAVRNYFNGYLAEWHYPPAGMLHYKCGRGWTRKAALRRLGQHIIQCNTPELHEAPND